jgi:sodium transport system permease protein
MIMFKDSLIIMRKELWRIFSDSRLLFMLVVLPLVLLPLVYFFMGRASSARYSEINSYSPVIAICAGEGGAQTRQLIMQSLSVLNAHIQTSGIEELDSLKQRVSNKEIELLIVMPDSMDQHIEENSVFDVSIYHNSTGDYSQSALAQVQPVFAAAAESIVKGRIIEEGLSEDVLTAFTVNSSMPPLCYDLAEKGSMMGKVIGMMMPFMVVIYLLANSMSVGLDSVAGEKERGTLAILLVNQVGRLSIVFGKMIAVMTAATVGAVSSAIGLKIASRYLIDMHGGSGASVSDYTMSSMDLLQFAVIVIPLAVLISSLVLLISTFARNVKEGQGMIMPVYIAVMVMGVSTMQTGDVPPHWMRIIPVFNSLLVLKDIFMKNAVWGNIMFSLASSLAVSAFLIFLTFRMFNDEKVLFRM